MINKFIKETLLRLDLFISQTTERAKIEKLISTLKPIKTQFELRRIGNKKGDGGYLVPNDLEGVDYCFSPGVSDEFSFDKELIDLGIKCFLADFSIDKSPIEDSSIKFSKKFIASFDSGIYINVNRWIDESIHDCDGEVILQMDIEGQEYEVINAFDIKKLKKFRILVIEFHNLHQLFNKFAFNIINNSFTKLLKYYRVVHIHPNNVGTVLSVKGIDVPNVMEFTFLRKDRIEKNTEIVNLPHKLDCKNVDRPNITLPDCWYK